MDATMAQNKMVAIPFASQFDEIDKALFEYRYKMQNQSNLTKMSHNRHGHAHAHRKVQNGLVNGIYMNHKSQGHRVQQVPCHIQQPHHIIYQQAQKHVHQQAQQQIGQGQSQGQDYGAQFNLNHAQVPQSFQRSTSNVLAQSPDSLVEGLVTSTIHDGFTLNLSSSISSGSGSMSSLSSDHDSSIKSPWDNALEKNKMTTNGNEFNAFNENNGYAANRAEKNFGWLNIWGNDMSVWG